MVEWIFLVEFGSGFGLTSNAVFRFGCCCCCKSTEIILSCKVWDKARLNFFVGLDLGFTLTVNIILRFVSS